MSERYGKIEKVVLGAVNDFVSSAKKCIIWCNDPSIGMAIDLDNEQATLAKTLEVYGERRKAIEDRGVIFVNNFELIAKFYLQYLMNVGVALPYTSIVMGSQPILQRYKGIRSVEKAAKQHADRYPPLIVKKPLDRHCGSGIEVLQPSIKLLGDLFSPGEAIYQEFIYPSFEIFSDGHMRDTRVVMIGGEPKAWYTRRAQDPLIDASTGDLVEYPPSNSRILTNVAMGGSIEELPVELRDKSLEFVREVYKAVLEFGNFYREQFIGSDKKDARCGFCSIDMLYTPDVEPLLLEVDFYPNLDAYKRLDMLASRFARYIKNLSQQHGKTPVYLLDPFNANKLTRGLQSQLDDLRVNSRIGSLNIG